MDFPFFFILWILKILYISCLVDQLELLRKWMWKLKKKQINGILAWAGAAQNDKFLLFSEVIFHRLRV